MTKRDAAIAVTSAVVAGALCYALAITRPNRPATPSHPFSSETSKTPAANGKVIMHVNGQPVTEAEFMAIYRQLPEEVQRQLGSDEGKMMLAEQTVRLKLLEQEAHRLGLERDPNIAAQLEADQANILANAAAEKLSPSPNDKAVQDFYEKNKGRFDSVDVSHILIAYAGGSIPAKSGQPPSLDDAKRKAATIYEQLKKGGDFATAAKKYSDDVQSGRAGGEMGSVSHGMLPPQLESQIFAAKTGDVTAPVISQYGIHIFKVNGRGAAPLTEMRAGITQRVRQEQLRDRIEALRKTAKVEFDPTFFPSTKKPPAKKPS